MGTYYYILDKSSNEIFETGKNYFYDLSQNFKKYFPEADIIKQSIFDHFEDRLSDYYVYKMADTVWKFLENRNPENIRFISEHVLYDCEYCHYNRCTLAGSCYYLHDKCKLDDYLQNENRRLEISYNFTKSRSNNFEEYGKYLRDRL